MAEKKIDNEELKKVNGGFENYLNQNVYCPNCGNTEESNFSFKFFSSYLINNGYVSQIYKCDVCNKYVATVKDSWCKTHCINLTEDDIDELIEKTWF